MKLIGAVGIKVRPVARDFKRELNSQINDLPEKSVNIKVDADTRPAERGIKNTKDKAEREGITLNVGVDYDGLRDAQQQIRQALKKVSDETPVTLKMNTDSLTKGLKDIEDRLGKAEIKMHVANDEAGFRAVLAKIEQIKRQKTEIEFPFTADTTGLKKAEQDARKRLRDIGIKISYINDRNGLQGAIAQLDAAIKNLQPRVTINPRMDLAELKKERERLQAELDAKPAVLKINKDVDGYTAALNKIRALQREAAAVTFRYNTDEAGLKEAADRLEKWKAAAIEKAGVTIRYQNDKAGLEGAIAELDKHLAKFRELTINPKLNEAALLKQKQKLEKELAAIPLEVTYNEDRAGLKQAIAELEKLKRDAAQVTLEYKNDPAGLDAMLDLLRLQLENEPVTVDLVPDKKGYETMLGQIEELQRLAESIDFTYNTDEQGLRDAADRLRENIAALTVSPTIDFKYKDDTTGIRGALAEIEKELEKIGIVKLTAELNEPALLEAKAELERKLADSTFEVKVNTKDLDALKRERDKLHQLLREDASEQVTLEVGTTEESLREAKNKIDNLIREAEANPVNLDVEPVGVALAAAQIGWAARSRVVPFYIRIDNKSRALAEGALKSLSGYNTLSSMGTSLEKLITNFDTSIAKGGTLAAVLGNVVNTLGYAVTNLLSVGDGMAQMIGLTAMAPAALSAAAAIVLVNVAAFRDFKGAIDGTKGALAKLPPEAQAAALALRGTWEAIQQPIQNAYWESMGTSLQDMVAIMIPKIKDGLAVAGGYIGLFAKNTADTFSDLGNTDMFDKMFGYLGTFFKNSAGIAEPLTRAINTLGLRGSEYLPQFGQWLTDITVQFNDWIQAADQAGDINTWIENGVTSLRDMWTAGDGVIDVIRAITRASMAAGGTTLGELADEMQRWGEIASGEPFQTRLTKIFAGARQGATNLNAGFKDLGRSVGEASHWVSNMLELLGDLGGMSLTNIATMFRNDTFKGGLYEAVSGLNDMMVALRPSFSSLASVIGSLGTTAGATFRGLAPLINIVTGALEDVMDIIGDELPGIATALTGQLGNTFSVIATAITLTARAVEPLLKGFLALPDAIQTVLLAAGGFMLMRGQISKMLTALSEKGHFRAFEGSWRAARDVAGDSANRMQVAGQMAATGVQTMANHTTGALGTARTAWGSYTTAVSGAQGIMRQAGTAMWQPIVAGTGIVKKGLGGLVGVLGGPVGAALAGATVAASLFAQANANAKTRVDNLAQSLNQQTAQATDSTKKLVATDWMQSATGKWDNFWRGVVFQSKAAHETVAVFGETTQEITDLITAGGPAYDDYIDKLDLITANLGGAKLHQATGLKNTSMTMEELSKATGRSIEELNKLDAADVSNLRKQMEGTRGELAKAEAKVRDVSIAMGVGEGEAATMAAAIKTLGDESSTAADRVDAAKSAIDRLKGGKLSQDQADREFAKSWEASMEQITQAATNAETGAKESLGHLIDDVDGHITDMSGKGGQLYDATKGFTDSLLDRSAAAAQHVLDNRGTMEEAQAAGVAALKLTEGELADWAARMGVETWEAQKLLENFIGQDWQAEAILGADAELFFTEMNKARAAGEELDQEEWNAILRARNLAAIGIAEAKTDGEGWSALEYSSVLKTMPEAALRTLAETLGVTDDLWMRGDFSSLLTALDGTGPGVAQALLNIAMVTDGDYAAEIQALIDALSLENTNAELDGAANADRSAHIEAVPHTEGARLALDYVANDRDANVTGVPHPTNAILVLNNAAKDRNAFFIGVPNTQNAEGGLNNTARQRNPLFHGMTSLLSAMFELNNAANTRTAGYRGSMSDSDKWSINSILNGIAAERTVSYRAKVTTEAANGLILNGNGSIAFANGGIYTPQVKRYAGGGVENHIAQISRGQTPHRIWSEPETGGEAYIPLSVHKRERSTQILQQVATQFGLSLSDKNTTQFANGGIVDGGRTGGSVSVNIGSYVTSQNDTPDDVARALMRRVKVQGANSPLEAF